MSTALMWVFNGSWKDYHIAIHHFFFLYSLLACSSGPVAETMLWSFPHSFFLAHRYVDLGQKTTSLVKGMWPEVTWASSLKHILPHSVVFFSSWWSWRHHVPDGKAVMGKAKRQQSQCYPVECIFHNTNLLLVLQHWWFPRIRRIRIKFLIFQCKCLEKTWHQLTFPSLLFPALNSVIHELLFRTHYSLPLHKLFFLSKILLPLLSYLSLKI